MDEKKIIYEIILSIWNIAKEFGFEDLTDDEWEKFIKKGMNFRSQFSKYGENIDFFSRNIFLSLNNYYERKNKK